MTQLTHYLKNRGGGNPVAEKISATKAAPVPGAAFLIFVLALPAGGALANTTTGMIDGNYAVQLPAGIYMRNSRGYTTVCIQITGSGSTATGTIKARRHNGTWESLTGSRTVTLLGLGVENPSNDQLGRRERAWLASWGPRPTNWNGNNRRFDEHGWRGHLTSGNVLRVAVDNHILKMTGDGRLPMTHGSSCP